MCFFVWGSLDHELTEHPRLHTVTAPPAMNMDKRALFACLKHCSRRSRASRLIGLPVPAARYAHAAAAAPAWRPSSALDEYSSHAHTHHQARTLTPTCRWVQREARPISLRRLTFFGRTLTESRLIDSANYCRLELPTRCYVPLKLPV